MLLPPVADAPAPRDPAGRFALGALLRVRFLKTLALLVLVGASLGSCLYSLAHRGLWPDYLAHNRIPDAQRAGLLWVMGASALLAIALTGVAQLRLGRRYPGIAGRLARRSSPLALSGFLPVLADPRSWQANDLAVLVLVPLFGWGLFKTVRLRQEASPVWRPAAGTRSGAALATARAGWRRLQATVGRQRFLPLLLVIGAVLAYAAYFSFHTIQTHYRFGTSSFDLGLEDNLVWNAAHGGPLFKMSPFGGPEATHAGNHQTYFAYVLAGIYRWLPGPETLLALQALLMGAAALPLFFIARRALGPWPGVLLATLYLLYPPLHGAALYDFHYLPLGTVFLWAAISAAETRRYLWMALALLLAASVREDVNAMMAVLGVLMIVEGKHVRAGLTMAAVGGLVFAVLKFVVMPQYTGGQHSFLHQYQDLVPAGGDGYPAVLATVLANPFYTLTTLLERDKLFYLLQILGPLVIFPLRRAVGLLACVVGIFFTLLSTRYAPQIQISFHYTTYWTTFLFLAVVRNLEWVRDHQDRGESRPSRAWLAAISAALLLSSIQYGAILDTRNTRGGFGAYRFGLSADDHERHRQVYSLIDRIPEGARVVASEMLVPHVSSRENAYTLRLGIYDAEYALFETPAREDEALQIRPYLKAGAFGVVDVQGGAVLAQRGSATGRNPEVLRLLSVE